MKDYRKEVYQLMLTTNKCIGVYYKIAKEMGVKENTLLLLDILSDQKQHSQKQICDDWHIPNFAHKVTHKMQKAEQYAMEKIQKEFSTDFITVFEKYVKYLEQEYK